MAVAQEQLTVPDWFTATENKKIKRPDLSLSSSEFSHSLLFGDLNFMTIVSLGDT